MSTTRGARAARIALLTVLVVLAAESLLASGALLDLPLRSGALPAALAALATYAAPGLVLAALAPARRHALRVAVAALVVLRAASHLTDGQPRWALGLACVALALAALVLAACDLEARDRASGVALGLGALAAVQGATGTWSPVWRGDALGIPLTAALLLTALLAVRRLDHLGTAPRGLWALGPLLGLGAFALASPGFLASQTQSGPHVVSGGWHLPVALLAVATALGVQRLRRTRAGALLPLLLAAAWLLPGTLPLAVVVALLAGVPVVGLLVLALGRREERHRGPLRLVGVGTGLGAILPLLLYQIDYDIPLGFPNWLLLVAAAAVVLLGARAWRRPPVDLPEEAPARPVLTAGAVVLALALLGFPAAWPGRASLERTEGTTLRLLSWNVHYGVNPEGVVDLEHLARAIEQHDPDVVALQEVSRGWILGAGTDAASWLSRRLGMGVVVAPAADRQFGNALLSRAELGDVVVTELPYGEGPQHRSAVTATVHLADGTPVRVSSVHLQHREENTATRLLQLEAVTADLVPTGPSLLAGDLNARPGDPEIATLEGSDWVSALDAVGDPGALTFSTWDPVERIDWVFGRHVEVTRAEVLTHTDSDHFAILVEAVPAR